LEAVTYVAARCTSSPALPIATLKPLRSNIREEVAQTALASVDGRARLSWRWKAQNRSRSTRLFTYLSSLESGP
jgi:hypothetical protein